MTTLTMHVARSLAASFEPGRRRSRSRASTTRPTWGPGAARAADRGLQVRTVDIRPDDVTLDIEAFDTILHERPRLVAFGWASNAVGSINPVAELVRRAHEAGALTYVDAVHAAPHVPIDVQAVGTDFLACSVYKFFGPHVGVLYGRREALEALPTLQAPGRPRPVRDRHAQLRGDRRGAGGGRVHRGARAAPTAASTRRAFPGMTGPTARRPRRDGGDPRLRDAAVRAAPRRPRGDPGRARSGGSRTGHGFAERTPTAAVTFAGHPAEAVSRALGRPGDRDLVGQLLRDRPDGAARPRAGRACSGSA